MKNFDKFLLIILFSFISLSASESATYYVNATIGNNGNTSAQAQNIATPWQTVQFAIDNPAVIDGDNIVVAEGTYPGFNLSKRLNIIGAWKGSNPAVNTVFNSTVILSALGGNAAERMLLKNLRIDGSAGEGVDIRSSFVTLENVFATNSAQNGIIISETALLDIRIEACNINANVSAGIYFPPSSGIDGFIMRNTTVNNNGYFGIAAFQRRINPTEIKNVHISHCAFVDNNPSNQEEGHTIYFEKLKNAVFENISVAMPSGNNWIGIDINLLSRLDYSNISILNSRISRVSPGSGIWIQGRDDLFDPPARLDTILIRGVTFTNCDTNIAFNRQVRNATVDKCDMSTYSKYGLINLTELGQTINADNNKWQNGGIPDTTVLSGGLLLNGNNVIALMPSTNGIIAGMSIGGSGIPAGTAVVSTSPNSVTMSNAATISGISVPIGFAFSSSTDIVRTSLNSVTTGNPLPNTIVNQANVSFVNLNDAIAGTSGGGTIWNLPQGLLGGVTLVNKNLKLIGPGAGFLHAPSLTTFEDLYVETDSFKMGSDFAVSGNFLNRSGNLSGGTIGTTYIGDDNTLSLNGAVNTGALIVGGSRSDIFVGGTQTNSFLPSIVNGLRTLQLNRANGISLFDSLRLHRLLFLQNGLLSLTSKNLTLDPNATIFAPFTATSYVNTNGSGKLSKDFNFSTPTFFNYTIGSGDYSPCNVFITIDFIFSPPPTLSAGVTNTKSPNNGCANDYLNRFWTISQRGNAKVNAEMKFTYVSGDVVGNEANIDGARFNGFLWDTFGPVDAAGNTFTAGNLNSFGDFSGGDSSCLNNAFTELHAKVILQGPYIGAGNMRISLDSLGFIPLSQPYNTPQFSYTGTESVTSIPAGVVDWVYIELRLTAHGIPVPNGRRAAFLKSDGSVTELDGISHVKFPGLAAGNYFVVVGHRFHLPVMTPNAEALSVSSSLYDFTDGLGKYFGGEAKNLGDGFFAMYGGDANRTFIVTAADFAIVTNNLSQSNYNFGDLNMSGTVTNDDYFYVTTNLTVTSNVPNYP